MNTSPILTQRIAELHQRDLRAAVAHARRVTQTRSATSPSARKERPLQSLSAVPSRIQALLRSTRAARPAAVLPS